jgi:diacylglycerol kinase family enzyme
VTRALVIANPVAARIDPGALRAVVDVLQTGGWHADTLATHGPGDARRFAEEAVTAGYDVPVSYGGDGTAMQIAAALVGTDPLGLIPGNGEPARGNLRLPRRPDAAARAIVRAPARRGPRRGEREDGTHYFAVACGAGFDAELMATTRRRPSSAGRWPRTSAAPVHAPHRHLGGAPRGGGRSGA